MRKLLLLLVVIFVATGCATTTTNNAPSPVNKVLGPKEGVVVVSVTGNTAQVNQFDDITVVRVQKNEGSAAADAPQSLSRGAPPPNAPQTPRQEVYVLSQSTRGLARDTAVFAGVLPEGEYYFDRFSDRDTHLYLPLTETMRNLLGTFTVSANTLSDLGRIVITPANLSVWVGRSTLVQTNEPLVKRFLPDLAKSYGGKTIAGWTRPKADVDISESDAVRFPVGATALTELSNGEVAAATRVGTVLLRDKNGKWRRASSEKLESLLWLTPYEENDSRLLAVGEFNTLMRLDRKDQLHPVDSSGLPPGNLIFITGNRSAGYFIAQTRGDEVFLYRSPTLENPKWEQIRSEKLGTSFWSGPQRFWAWPTSKGFAYGVSKGDIHVYDYASKKWTDRKAPNDRSLVGVEAFPSDVWGIITSPGGGFAGIFAKTHYTRDFGATWTETNSPYSVKVSAPKITPKGTILETGGVFGKAGIQASSDNGKTWKQVIEKPVLGDVLWVMPTTGLFLITDGKNGIETIEHSTDEGVTWRFERSTFNRQLYDQQNPKKN